MQVGQGNDHDLDSLDRVDHSVRETAEPVTANTMPNGLPAVWVSLNVCTGPVNFSDEVRSKTGPPGLVPSNGLIEFCYRSGQIPDLRHGRTCA